MLLQEQDVGFFLLAQRLQRIPPGEMPAAQPLFLSKAKSILDLIKPVFLRRLCIPVE